MPAAWVLFVSAVLSLTGSLDVERAGSRLACITITMTIIMITFTIITIPITIITIPIITIPMSRHAVAVDVAIRC